MAVKPRKYELVYIAEPDRSETQIGELTTEIKSFIENEGGTIEHVEQWGKKKLAYLVKKHRYGHFTMVIFDAPPEIVAKLERMLKHHDNVIKYISLLRDARSTLMKPPAGDSSTFYSHDRFGGGGRDRH